MPPDVPTGNWPEVDSWWGEFRRHGRLIFAAPSIREIDETWTEQNWANIDPLWNAYGRSRPPHVTGKHVRNLQNTENSEAWKTVDAFWDSYAEQQQTDFAELQKLMTTLREMWRNGASQFDDDPLTSNWRPQSKYEGPLRATVVEEDWSQWLAHLLRTSSGAFVRKLLGAPDRQPETVRREVTFIGERSNRRADILVEYENTAVSIEVKNGDEHYGKTPHTAGLIEQHDGREWSHFLLVKKEKLPRLRQTFDEALDSTDEDNPTVRSDQSADIEVCFWQDVSRSLRWTLLDGSEPDSHWAASAYLFITLIEQRLLEYRPSSFATPTGTTRQPSVDDSDSTASDSDSTAARKRSAGSPQAARCPGATDLHRLVAADLASQIDYLRSVINEDSKHE